MRTITGRLKPSILIFAATLYCPPPGRRRRALPEGRVQPKQALFDSLLIDWIKGE